MRISYRSNDHLKNKPKTDQRHHMNVGQLLDVLFPALLPPILLVGSIRGLFGGFSWSDLVSDFEGTRSLAPHL
jgi:hypothetical protein